MKTTCAIVVAAVLGASLSLPAAEPPASGPNVFVRPNVLILFADDMRADAIAALGNPVIKTPNLDRLVRRGVAFDRAYMQGSFTPATCVPSRAMLMTGRSLFHIDAKRSKEATWPEAFGEAGYTTFVSGKWHNTDAMLTRSFQIARSMYVGGMCGVTGPAASEGLDVSGCVRDARWKLIRYPQVDRTKLFDLENDPHEATNLADQPEHAAKVAELTALLEQEMQRSGGGIRDPAR